MHQRKQKRGLKKRGRVAGLTRGELEYVSGDETIAELQRRIDKAPPGVPANPKGLPLADIHVAYPVFQWRQTNERDVEGNDLIYDMARSLLRGEKLPPLLMFHAGDRDYVVDGHHRLAAYHSAKWSKLVPVVWFAGSLKAAHVEALRCNSKKKLPMTKRDKTEAAWRLVKEQWLTIEQEADFTGTSPSNISIMRGVRGRLSKDPELEQMTWTQARRADLRIEYEYDEEGIEKAARKMADRMLKLKIGQGLMVNTDVTARALQMINENLPWALVWEWFNHHELQEMIDDAKAPLDDGPLTF